MKSLEAELVAAREVDVDAIAASIESVGFECTRCGECCTADGEQAHTATVFPDEIRTLQTATDREWSAVARPMPYGLDADGQGETFEWALQVDDCGDCVFYEEADGLGACSVHPERPFICQTYPFSLDIGDGGDAPGAVVEQVGALQVHECEGVGRDISRADARDLAETLKRRTIVELREAIAVRDGYESVDDVGTVVHDSEGAKRADGTPISGHGDNY
ncbi:MAG: YkgJ family cysteine cluster protein [Halobacteriota archaeon]